MAVSLPTEPMYVLTFGAYDDPPSLVRVFTTEPLARAAAQSLVDCEPAEYVSPITNFTIYIALPNRLQLPSSVLRGTVDEFTNQVAWK